MADILIAERRFITLVVSDKPDLALYGDNTTVIVPDRVRIIYDWWRPGHTLDSDRNVPVTIEVSGHKRRDDGEIDQGRTAKTHFTSKAPREWPSWLEKLVAANAA